MNKLDKDYQALLQDILDNGHQKGDRTGTGTLSTFGRQIRHKMSEGFPLLTTKKMYFKGIVTELLWFLRGDTNIKYLVDNDCHIWDGDAYKKYKQYASNLEEPDMSVHVEDLEESKIRIMTEAEFVDAIKNWPEFSKVWGELGPVYGKQWRKWKFTDKFTNGEQIAYVNGNIDQITNLIRDLKTNPDSRRLMVNAWNVGELDSMTLPPCHYGFQVYTRELSLEERNDLLNKKTNRNHKRENCFSDEEFERETLQDCKAFNIPTRAISLMWNQRSVDTFLGLPFNIASYGLLLEIIAKAVNMVPDELIGNLGDTHLYLNHIEQAKEQIGRELSLDERKKLYENEFTPGMEVKNDEWLESKLTTREIPKRTREPYPLPKLVINDEFWNPDASLIEQIEHIEISDFEVRDYQSHPIIKAPLSN